MVSIAAAVPDFCPTCDAVIQQDDTTYDAGVVIALRRKFGCGCQLHWSRVSPQDIDTVSLCQHSEEQRNLHLDGMAYQLRRVLDKSDAPRDMIEEIKASLPKSIRDRWDAAG